MNNVYVMVLLPESIEVFTRSLPTPEELEIFRADVKNSLEDDHPSKHVSFLHVSTFELVGFTMNTTFGYFPWFGNVNRCLFS